MSRSCFPLSRVKIPRNSWLLGAVGLLVVSFSGWADADDLVGRNRRGFKGRETEAAIRATAKLIDDQVFNAWAKNSVFPAKRSSDTEFFRRAWLDVAGRIPPASEARQFLASDSKSKRQDAVRELVEGPGYVVNFTNYWQNVLIPESTEDVQVALLMVPSFKRWLRRKLVDDAKYDEIAFELLTVYLNGSPNIQQSPAPFYALKRNAPESLAAATARAFLGIRIECAQCHDHPYDTWKREEFWSFAAFFGGFSRSPNRISFAGETPNMGTIRIPELGSVVRATYLTGQPADLVQGVSPRVALASWVVSPDNPYFARAAVNRIWGHLFGRGLVDPVDDLSDLNPPSHPKMLNQLAEILVEQDFDMKFMLRAIMASSTYQLTSKRRKNFDPPPELFAIREVKGMTSDQLYDSIQQAIGKFEPFVDKGINVRRLGPNPKSEFLSLFKNNADVTTETPTTILQALAMMNGTQTASATSLSSSKTLSAVVEFPTFSTDQRVEALYFATLSRPPSDQEMELMLKHVEPSADWKSALGDVFWALLNSSEFKVNH